MTEDPAAPIDRAHGLPARRAESDRRRQVIRSGDAASIKRIYLDYGEELLRAHHADPSGVPLLSLPQTGPVVVGLLDHASGLVLDAGCGPKPAVAVGLTGPSRRVVAMDIAHPIACLARAATAGDGGSPLLFVVGDLENVPFRNGCFDAVVCDDTIEHVPDDRAAAAELARVTTAGGRVVVATPNRWSLAIVVAKLRDTVKRRRREPAHYYVADSHLREYTRRELMTLLRPHFLVRRWATVAWPGGVVQRLAGLLTALPVLRSFNQMLVVEVEPRPRRELVD
jgi:SAM-dependent methyltransferase